MYLKNRFNSIHVSMYIVSQAPQEIQMDFYYYYYYF